MEKTQELMYRTFIEPAGKKNYRLIGAEFEYPLMAQDGKSYRERGDRFLKYLTEEHGFTATTRGSDGALVRVERDHDGISFDTVYSTLEFAVSPQTDLCEIERRRLACVELAREWYAKEGVELLAMGSVPRKEEEMEYVLDPYYTLIRRYQEQFTSSKSAKHFGGMCSVQTHLDIPLDKLLDTYNLFNELSFVRGLLLSNSPGVRDGKKVYCTRDLDWEVSEIPNTGLYDTKFASLGELAQALSREIICFTDTGNGMVPMSPRPLCVYFSEAEHPDTDVSFYRSLKHIVINKYSCVEVREDCTQPFGEAMVPTAFNLGLALSLDRAADILREFKTVCRITGTNTELRRKAISGYSFGDDETVRKYLMELYDCAFEALKERGFGEEEFLKPLEGRIERLECPAMRAEGR